MRRVAATRSKVQNSFSYPVPLLSGVPQGSVLSPILYIFYSSDFPVSDLHQTKTRFFADDTALWTSRTTAASASRTLQPLLNQISTWTRKWRVKINPTKSTAILFKHPNLTRNKKFDPRDITITLDNTPIDLVPSTRYLGITYTHTCSLDTDLQNTLKKVRNRSNLLRHLMGNFQGCHSRTLLHTYNTFIRPVIEYRAPIYASLPHTKTHRIATCERQILRRIHRLDRFHASNSLHQDTNTTPITDRLHKLQQNYIKRTLNNNNTIAQNTLNTSHKFLTRDNTLRNRVPRIPRRKLPHPPTALLSALYPDLPDNLQLLVEETPLTMRRH
ncbi:putative RNA-directed DNA polymerase from transposon BS-like Protein [Tribolium castaneum]|uniref:Putative RNA-directed DNA polymerase from transposon BS-like Protein n=1 Tax=Tribolium castaneum TaxID=7070 RepID=D6WUJ9_TRICA|nr:putative RNA-directed DNA polymerase from transposon BS-like Protein [Tribolium castaneum]